MPQILGGRYLLEEHIASGGMASVWRAHDELLARTVAVKLLHDHLAADEDFRERFRREAVAAAKLTHPNVVGLYDTGREGDRVYLVMEYVDGMTLKDAIADLGSLDAGQVATIGEKIGRALGYAHQRGLIHRDVKPANILLGESGAVKVADFGIAKAEEDSRDLTRTGMVLGTAAYVAPEQVLAQPIDGQADQYSLGCVLYEALTGRQPFQADSPVATAGLRIERDPLPLRSVRPDIPRGLDAIVLRAMSRDPAQRFPTVGQLADALAEFAEPNPTLIGAVAPHPVTQPLPTEEEESFLRSEGKWLAPVVGLLVLAATLVGVGLWTGVLESGDGFPIQFARDGAARESNSVLIPVADVQAFDPPPGDGVESDGRLDHLLDGDSEATWRTEMYDNAAFGNLKDGVGFWLDLGAPHELELVALRTTTPGISYEIRVADAPAPNADGWTRVGEPVLSARELEEVGFDEPSVARYVLVWLTGDLQPRDGRFTAEFSAVAIRGRPQ